MMMLMAVAMAMAMMINKRRWWQWRWQYEWSQVDDSICILRTNSTHYQSSNFDKNRCYHAGDRVPDSIQRLSSHYADLSHAAWLILYWHGYTSSTCTNQAVPMQQITSIPI